MKKKNFFRVAALLAAASVGFAGCSKDGDDVTGGGDSSFNGEVSATVSPPSSDKVDAVKAVAWVWDGNGSNYVLVEETYQGGSFTLTLPTTELDAYLTSVKDKFDIPGIIVDTDAKGVECRFWAYKDGRQVGDFLYGSESDESVFDESVFMYVNKDVNITGSFSEEGSSKKRTFKVSLKRGWNKMYIINSASSDVYTTTEPSGMKWYFEDWYNSNN